MQVLDLQKAPTISPTVPEEDKACRLTGSVII